MKIDELRIIEHTNTQVRFLPIISQILKTIGNKSYTLSMLKNILEKWSIEQERTSIIYKNHNGILTNNEKPTTAFAYYIELMLNIGLITKINEVTRVSKYGYLFLILERYSLKKSFFSEIEKLFYIFFILLKDADNVILILQIIDENDGKTDNSFLRGQYETYLKNRLKLKSTTLNSFVQSAISDKLRRVEYIWQNPKEYSKHIIPPRLEWLIDIGILKEEKPSLKKIFTFTEFGKNFYKNLELIDNSSIKDINDLWLVNKFIFELKDICNDKIDSKDFSMLSTESKSEYLNELLPMSYKELDIDGIRRISALPFYIFVMIIGLVKYNLIISFSALKDILLQSFSTKEYTFAFREATRINESYLTVIIN